MSEPKNHHHVPQFLLAGWCRHDGRLAVYSRAGGRAVIDWHRPEYTAFEPHLYSIHALPESDRQWVEREIMTKAVDDPASKVLRRLCAGELHALDQDERSSWTRLILAQWMRTPTMIERLRRDGREALLRELQRDPHEYLAVRGDDEHPTLEAWTTSNARGLDEIVALGRVLPQMINSKDAGDTIINMRWEVLDLTSSPVDLLTSDQPVVRIEGLKSSECLIVMPLDRVRLFVASHYDRRFTRVRARDLAMAANRTMVSAAHERVFGSGDHHRPLVEKLLRNTPA